MNRYDYGLSPRDKQRKRVEQKNQTSKEKTQTSPVSPLFSGLGINL